MMTCSRSHVSPRARLCGLFCGILALLLAGCSPAVSDASAPALAEKQVALAACAPREGEGVPLLLVNADHPLAAEPEGLVNLYAQKGRGFSLANSSICLTEETFLAAKAMFTAAAADGMEGFILSSGYRDREAQAAEYEKDPETAAQPGTSEHETGLAFDVTAYGPKDFSRTPQYEWLYAHCWDYGFILRYPAGKEAVTGIPAESWHYRYVGQPHARLMGELGLCLEEYADYVTRHGPLTAAWQGRVWGIQTGTDGVICAFPEG